MNRNLIFALILLATLFTVNAAPHQLLKRAPTEFLSCSTSELLAVKIKPDPPVSEKPEDYKVSGTLKNDITAAKTVLVIGYIDTAQKSIGDPFVQQFAEPVKAGSPFSIEAPKVPTPKLPDSYFIVTLVGDPTDDPKNPLDVFGCAYASVTSAKTPLITANIDAIVNSYPIASAVDSYPIAERSYPIAERSYPIAERSYPIAGRSYPIAERSYFAERSYPIAERSYPIAESSYFAESSYPIAERSYPIAERSYPIAE